LEAEWQPQTRTERCHLKTMVTFQWLLARAAVSANKIYDYIEFGERQFVMLGYVAKQWAQLERSFRTAVAECSSCKRSPKPGRSRPPGRRRQLGL
jgi:hypothetical protein